MKGNKPRITRNNPPVATTKRLLTPVTATRPTFWAKALWVNEPKIGANMLDSMSARRPLPRRFESTLVSMISPTARMSAEVSTRVTITTMHMEMIAATWKVGMPKWNGVGKPNIGPWVTPEKSAMPRNTAITVPMTIANRIDRREMVALPILLSNSTSTSVNAAKPMLDMLPKSAARLLPPMAQRAATGIRVRPMVVITMPVTSGGKNLVIRENTGVINNPINDAAMTAPRIAGTPPAPSLPTIATMVATPANDTPCTSGN